jgi:hypothetical protein
MMTVKEMRELLKNYPDSMELYISDDRSTDIENGKSVSINPIGNKVAMLPVDMGESTEWTLDQNEPTEAEEEYMYTLNTQISNAEDVLHQRIQDLNGVEKDEDLSDSGKKKKKKMLEEMISKIKDEINQYKKLKTLEEEKKTREANKVLVFYYIV